MTTSRAKILWICLTLALGTSFGCSGDATSAGDQGPDKVGDDSERTLEDDVADIMLKRSDAALNEDPGGGKPDCFATWNTCLDGCQQYNTRWDAVVYLLKGSSPYSRCQFRCDLAYDVCEGATNAAGGGIQ